MKLYKVTLYNSETSSDGFAYFASAKEARACVREYRTGFLPQDDVDTSGCKIERIRVDLTRKGILAALNRHASHNDNG